MTTERTALLLRMTANESQAVGHLRRPKSGGAVHAICNTPMSEEAGRGSKGDADTGVDSARWIPGSSIRREPTSLREHR